jgi:hypothetical protein
MPSATTFTINNGAATPVAKTFTLYAPASGDGGVAEWRLKEGAISSVFPKVTASARANAGHSARKSQIGLKVPSSYTDTVTGLTKVGSAFDARIEVTVPDDFPEALKNDAVAFLKNLVAHAIFQDLMRDGTPAT